MTKAYKVLVFGFINFIILTQHVVAQENDSKVSETNESNEKILKRWQDISGQAGTIENSENGATIEWHGEATVDLYNTETSFDDQNGQLSGLQEGTFTQTRLLGDLREIEQSGDVTYAQGGIALNRDRSRQTLYSSRIENLQVGRAGVGYQLSAGDIVSSFSNIGSNLGLRGVYGAKQVNALTFQGFAGTVTESWEALINRTPFNNQPARTRFLRDVVGFKVDYKLTELFSVFGTAQSYKDRQSSLSDSLSNQQIGLSGKTGTAGLAYKDNKTAISLELGTSSKSIDETGGNSFGDAAILFDATYTLQNITLFAGHHHIGANYTSLSSNIISGIRESFVGGNWIISPNFTYTNRIARSDTKPVDFLGNIGQVTQTDSIINQLNFSVTQIPGLNISLQDTRNWTDLQEISNRNTSTQLGVFYSNQQYSGGLTLSNGRQRSSNAPQSNSTLDGIDLNLGRQFQEGELLAIPTISGGVRMNAGYQQQRIQNGTETSLGSQGVSVNLQSKKVGQLVVGFTNQDRSQSINRSVLNSKIINLDWNKSISEALALKAYVRNNYLNHGDSLQRVDEKTVGFIADYLW